MSKQVISIPEPTNSPRSMQNTVLALKEATEVLLGQRGPSPVVRWDDLVRLGIISDKDVPR